MGGNIRSHRELQVYQRAFAAAMRIYEISRDFPDAERYAMTSQIRRSSRSVCSNIAEAWRKRRYEAAFIAKLSDAESEAAETQSHLEFCVACEFVSRDEARRLYSAYNAVLRTLVGMMNHASDWTIRRKDA